MKLSKKLPFAILIFCLTIQFGGCSLLSESESKQNTAGEEKVREGNPLGSGALEERKVNKGKEIVNFQEDIKNLQAKQSGLAKKILKRDDAEINEAVAAEIEKKCKPPKPPAAPKPDEDDNVTSAPATGAGDSQKNPGECKNFDDNKKIISDNNKKLTQAKGDLKTIENQIADAEKSKAENGKSSVDGSGLSAWLIIGSVGLALLTALLGSIFFLNKKIKDEAGMRNRDVNSIKGGFREYDRQIKELKDAAKVKYDLIERQIASVEAQQRQSKESDKNVIAHEPEAFYQPPQTYKPELQFPITAEDYLTKVKANSQTATADLIGGLLIHDTDRGNEFLIIKDNNLTDGVLYVVPNAVRFSTKGDYLNYYEKYYNCDNPSGGTIWIKSRSVVRQVEGGWKLLGKGELEVR